MAGEQVVVELRIGSSVDLALGEVFNRISERVGQLKSQLVEIGGLLKGVSPGAAMPGGEISAAQERGAASAVEWLTALERVGNSLNDQVVAVGELGTQYQALGQAIENLPVRAGAALRSDHGATLIGAADKAQAFAGKPMAANERYRSVINDLAIKGGVSGNAGRQAEQEQKITTAARSMKDESGMGKVESVSLIQQMVDAGITVEKAIELAPLAARYSVGQGVGGKDTATLFRSLQDAGISSPDKVAATLEGVVAQSRSGTLSMVDISRLLPRVLPELMRKGIDGKDGQASALRGAAMLQQRADTAGTHVEVVSDVKRSIVGYLPAVDTANAPQYGQNYVAKASTEGSFLRTDLQLRRNDPAQKQKELAAANDDVSVSVGSAIQPTTDVATAGLTSLANTTTQIVDAFKPVVNAAAAVTLGLIVVAKSAALFRGGKTLWDAGKGLFKATPPGNGSGGGAGGALGRAGRRLLGLEDKGATSPRPERPAFKKVVATDITQRKSKVDPATRPAEKTPEASEAAAKKAKDSPQPVKADKSISKGGGAAAPGVFSKLMGSAGKLGAVVRRLPGGRFLDAGVDIARTALGDGNPVQKAVAYTKAAGGLGSAMAGAAAGAALLSFIPLVGPIIGGIGGGIIGGEAFDRGFSAIGKYFSGAEAKAKDADEGAPAQGDVARQIKADNPQASVLPEVAPVVPGASATSAPTNMAFTLNMPVTVQGSAENPTLLAQTIQPMVRQAFDDAFNQSRSTTAMYDDPSVTVLS